MNPVLPLIVLSVVCLPNAADAQTSDRVPDSQPATTKPSTTGKRPRWVPGYPGPWDAALHVARSKDGLTFKPTAKPLIRFADAPTLAWLPDGRLLAVFKYYSRADRHRFGGLAFAYSNDKSKTWSKVKPLEIERLKRRLGPPRGPALAVRPDGGLQLVFVCKDRKDRRRVLIAEAKPRRDRDSVDEKTSSESPNFKLTGRLEPVEDNVPIDDPAVLYIGDKCHLFGTLTEVAGQRYHGISRTGRRCERLDNLHVADVGTQGNAINIKDGYRFYATSAAGILSATSPDGLKWSRDGGLRLTGNDVSDPAVARLKDGTYLMLYVKSPPGAHGRRWRDRDNDDGDTDAAPSNTDDAGNTIDESLGDDWWHNDDGAESADDNGDFIDADESGEEDVPVDDGARADETDGNTDTESQDAEGEDGPADTEESFESYDTEPYEHEYTDSGVPLPDFVRPVDYQDWLQQRHDLDSVEDNAYDYYAALLLDSDGKAIDMADLPNFQCMINDHSFVGNPGPWSPEDHPEWDESYYATADLVAQFIEATTHEDFTRPLMFAQPVSETADENGVETVPNDPLLNDLLINFLLPDLSGHRRMVKQTLSCAWRAPDGKPDPEVMLEAFDACLSNAEHLNNGDTLIEMLVGIAEKHLVEKEVRWALRHEVFSADEMETILELLIEKDHPLPDPSQWVEGELAMSLDTAQYLFGPIEESREPALNPQRIKQLDKMFDPEGGFFTLPTPEEMTATDAEQTVSNFVEYYRKYSDMVRSGYPEVTAKDLDEMAKPYREDNYVARQMVPSLSRVYQIATRQEASRRATQLTYAIHLHQAQTGEWPASLDDLPFHYADAARTDPFSGQDFIYRMTEDGPLLYSASENGQDDGGIHRRRWGDRNIDEEESDDYVFWPPQKR